MYVKRMYSKTSGIHQEINFWGNFIVNNSLHINILLLILCVAHSIAFHVICNLT